MSDSYLDSSQPLQVTARILPHWTQEGKIYFVTFRLADSLPQTKLADLIEQRKLWLKNNPLPHSSTQKLEYHRLFDRNIDKWLDSGYGACVLKYDATSKMVEEAMCFYEGKRYSLHGYVVMSNHVHILIQPFYGIKLSGIPHSIKSYTANKINEYLGQHGKLWAIESYDRIIRDACHYTNVKEYLLKNVKEGGVRWRL